MSFGSFGERLRKLRNDKGLSQDALARLLGYKTSASVSKLETMGGPLEIESLQIISKALDADLHWLITGQPAPSVGKVINLLYPFVSMQLTQIADKVEALENERKELRYEHFDDPVPPFRLEKIQEEIDFLHTKSYSILTIINEKLDAYRHKSSENPDK